MQLPSRKQIGFGFWSSDCNVFWKHESLSNKSTHLILYNECVIWNSVIEVKTVTGSSCLLTGAFP